MPKRHSPRLTFLLSCTLIVSGVLLSQLHGYTFMITGQVVNGLNEPTSISSHFDRIPNFCQVPTIISIQDGAWSNPSTWDLGRVPQNNDIVMVQAGHDVTYDVLSPVTYSCVGIHGTLEFSRATSTRLTAQNILVYADGTMFVGTAAQPMPSGVTADIVIADRPLDIVDDGVGVYDPQQYGNGLLVFGTFTSFGESKGSSYYRLAQEGTGSSLTLVLPVPNSWRPGDAIIVPDSMQRRDPSADQPSAPERHIIASISSDRRTITMTTPLRKTRVGARDGTGQLRYLPHIGNMTRNVVIRSENPSGNRGHTLYTDHANVTIENTAFVGLGRTTFQRLNNTSFNANGTIAAIGTNQLGRYPLHIHHVVGPRPSQLNGHQFTIVGNAIDGGDTAHEFKWGITVHGSSYGLVQDNTIYNYGGAGIMTEDGSEIENVFENNFIVWVDGAPGRSDSREGGPIREYGFEGSAIWLRGAQNYIRRNVAANIRNGYAYIVMNGNTVRIPLFPGADTMKEGEYRLVNLKKVIPPDFSDNEVYGTVRAMQLWDFNARCCTWITRDTQTALIKNFTAWHIDETGLFGYGMSNTTIDHWVQINDKNIVQNSLGGGGGLGWSDYLLRRVLITNSEFQNLRTGVSLPPKFGDLGDEYGWEAGDVTVENSIFSNAVNISMGSMWAVQAGSFPPRRAVIRNVKFIPMTGPSRDGGPRLNIQTNLITAGYPGINLIRKSELFVYDYNQQPGNNFKVFFQEQAPSYILPESVDDRVGAPAPGLTNLENMATYGLAMNGEIATCSDTTSHPEIDGFTCPINAAPVGTVNAAPVVDIAGSDMTTTSRTITMSATAIDDGKPATPGSLTYSWKAVGVNDVIFGSGTSLTTTVRFPTYGQYRIRFLAMDGGSQAGQDDVVVNYTSATGINSMPSVQIQGGATRSITMPSALALTAFTQDDGLPSPPGVFSLQWEKVSGPGFVRFTSPNYQTTSATFFDPGVYVIRLTGSDGELSRQADVTVTVYAADGTLPPSSSSTSSSALSSSSSTSSASSSLGSSSSSAQQSSSSQTSSSSLVSSASSATKSFCALVQLQQRARLGQTYALSAASLTVRNQAGAVVATTTGPLAADGRFSANSAAIFSSVTDDTSTPYTIELRPHGHVPLILSNQTGIFRNCLSAGTAHTGDFDGDGAIGINDIVRGITFYRTGTPDLTMSDVYRAPMGLADLVELIANYRGQQ